MREGEMDIDESGCDAERRRGVGRRVVRGGGGEEVWRIDECGVIGVDGARSEGCFWATVVRLGWRK